MPALDEWPPRPKGRTESGLQAIRAIIFADPARERLTHRPARVKGGLQDTPAERPRARSPRKRTNKMAKPTTIKIRLNSTADTGHFYVTKKNARTMTEKMVVRKYDPVARKHVEYKEGKIK